MSKDVSIWSDEDGENLFIGNECSEGGDFCITVPLNKENVLAWIKALVLLLDDSDLFDVPGEIVKVFESENG